MNTRTLIIALIFVTVVAGSVGFDALIGHVDLPRTLTLSTILAIPTVLVIRMMNRQAVTINLGHVRQQYLLEERRNKASKRLED